MQDLLAYQNLNSLIKFVKYNLQLMILWHKIINCNTGYITMNDPQNTITKQGLRLKLRRKALGLSAEALASKMSELGVPVSRGAIKMALS